MRASAFASVLAGVLAFVVSPLQGRFTGEFEDYQDYLAAAKAVVQRGDIYGTFVNHVQPIPVEGFDYPPIVAWLLQPLAWLPAHVAATTWLLFLVGCTVAGTAIIALELLPATWPRLELVAIFSFLYAPVTYNLWHGQMSAVVYLFLALALRSWLRDRQVSLGLFIAIAACIKLAPVVLVVLLIRRRWWKGVAALCGGLAVGIGGGVLALGFGTLNEYATRVLPVLSWQNGWIYNQSFAGAINRLIDHSVLAFGTSLPIVSVLTIAFAVTVIVATAMVVRPAQTSREVRGAQFGITLLAMLLAGSVTWFWHLGAVLVVLAAVTALAVSGRARHPRRLIAGTLAIVLVTGVLAPLLIAFISMARLIALSHTWLWWPALQLISAPAFALGALFVMLFFELRHPASAADNATVRHRALAASVRG